jgi:hypothetical protein
MPPSESEIQTQLRYAVDVLDELRKAAGVTASTNTLDLIDTLQQALEGVYAGDTAGAADNLKRALEGVFGQGSSLILGPLREWANSLSTEAPKLDPASVLDVIYDRMIASGDRIASRCITRGSPSLTAGPGGGGNGNLHRLSLDERTLALEACYAEAKVFRCTKDQTTGADKHEEEFAVSGAVTARNPELKRTGSGLLTTIKAVSARNSLLGNPSFSQYAGTTAVPTSLTNWTVTTSIANFALDGTNYYRDFPGDTTPYALQIKANDSITQRLDLRRTRLDPNTPYFLQIAYNREVNSCNDGTLRIRLGGQTVTVALAAQTGWNILKIAVDQNLWYRNFLEQNLDIVIALESSTTYDVLVDDVILVPMTAIDGAYYTLVGGSTPYLRDDYYTVTDSEIGAVIQYWIWRLFGRYLPAQTPAPTTGCTAALAGLGAGNVNTGTHSYKVAFVRADESGGASGLADAVVSNTVTTDTATNGQVALTAIPVGPSGTTARRIYRTAAGNAVTGPWKLLATISDNSTTIYADNIADGSLGANMSGGVTITDP